jgi:branched-chain amino acid transport system ATP-binding protein
MAGYLLPPEELKERIDLVLDIFPTLTQYLKRKAGTLSGGERQILAIAMCLIRNAKILLLDEPTAQLAPKIATYVLNKIVELRDRLGMTIVLVEQNAKKALEIGDRAYLLVSGRVVFSGKAQELLEHRELGKLYLGLV